MEDDHMTKRTQRDAACRLRRARPARRFCAARTPTRSAAARTATTGRSRVSISAANGTVRIKARPHAIVSLSPTATEMLYAIGAGEPGEGGRQVLRLPEERPAHDPRRPLSPTWRPSWPTSPTSWSCPATAAVSPAGSRRSASRCCRFPLRPRSPDAYEQYDQARPGHRATCRRPRPRPPT